LSKKDCEIENYENFVEKGETQITSIINYLLYLDEKAKVIKSILKERNRIKML